MLTPEASQYNPSLRVDCKFYYASVLVILPLYCTVDCCIDLGNMHRSRTYLGVPVTCFPFSSALTHFFWFIGSMYPVLSLVAYAILFAKSCTAGSCGGPATYGFKWKRMSSQSSMAAPREPHSSSNSFLEGFWQ